MPACLRRGRGGEEPGEPGSSALPGRSEGERVPGWGVLAGEAWLVVVAVAVEGEAVPGLAAHAGKCHAGELGWHGVGEAVEAVAAVELVGALGWLVADERAEVDAGVDGVEVAPAGHDGVA